MPYSQNPAVETPPEETVLWRYMDLTKFISLLEEGALYFPNLVTLADPLEGFLTRPTVERIAALPDGLTEEEAAQRRKIAGHNLAFFRDGRSLLYVSCWHENPYESVAMWGLYLKSGEGVAIRSSVGRMMKSLEDNPEPIHIGRVKYVDYDQDEVPYNNALYLALHKRKSFEYEREVRAIILNPTGAEGGLVPLSLPTLIETVYVAPTAPKWMKTLLEKIVQRYALELEVKHSGIQANPLY